MAICAPSLTSQATTTDGLLLDDYDVTLGALGSREIHFLIDTEPQVPQTPRTYQKRTLHKRRLSSAFDSLTSRLCAPLCLVLTALRVSRKSALDGGTKAEGDGEAVLPEQGTLRQLLEWLVLHNDTTAYAVFQAAVMEQYEALNAVSIAQTVKDVWDDSLNLGLHSRSDRQALAHFFTLVRPAVAAGRRSSCSGSSSTAHATSAPTQPR